MTDRRDRPGAVASESVDDITDALLTVSRLLVAISAQSIAAVDESITTAQFRTIVILSTRGPMNVAALAEMLDVQPSTATRMVDRLVAAGLIDRSVNPRSRRELILALTGHGRRVVDAVTQRRRGEIARVVAQMPVAERHGLVRALNAFTTAGHEPVVRPETDTYQL